MSETKQDDSLHVIEKGMHIVVNNTLYKVIDVDTKITGKNTLTGETCIITQSRNDITILKEKVYSAFNYNGKYIAMTSDENMCAIEEVLVDENLAEVIKFLIDMFPSRDRYKYSVKIHSVIFDGKEYITQISGIVKDVE